MTQFTSDIVSSLGGAEAVAQMTHEQRADALEDFQIEQFDAEMAKRKKSELFPTTAELADQIETRKWRRGSGKLFRPSNQGDASRAIRKGRM